MAHDTKEKILKQSLSLFNELGYIDVGVREIARKLDISPGNLSYHFSKKEDILFTLLHRFSKENTDFYEAYFAAPPTNALFLALMKDIFDNQYQYRGVYVGNQHVQKALRESDRLDYDAVAAKRVAFFKKIFHDLHLAGQISVTKEDVSFLVSYITLFARFWISEATLFNKSPDQVQTVGHYLSLLTRQLSLFATSAGKKSIDAFVQRIE